MSYPATVFVRSARSILSGGEPFGRPVSTGGIMKVRRLFFLLAASALAVTATSAGVPAQAASCVPRCAIAGQVVGSIIHPGEKFNFKGNFTSGTHPGARFNIEGPYRSGTNGTLRITGHRAPNFSVAVTVTRTASGFRVQNAPGEQQFFNANFAPSGNSHTSNDASSTDGGFDGGGGDGGGFEGGGPLT